MCDSHPKRVPAGDPIYSVHAGPDEAVGVPIIPIVGEVLRAAYLPRDAVHSHAGHPVNSRLLHGRDAVLRLTHVGGHGGVHGAKVVSTSIGVWAVEGVERCGFAVEERVGVPFEEVHQSVVVHLVARGPPKYADHGQRFHEVPLPHRPGNTVLLHSGDEGVPVHHTLASLR